MNIVLEYTVTLFPYVWFAAVVKLTLKQISSPSNLLNIHDIYTGKNERLLKNPVNSMNCWMYLPYMCTDLMDSIFGTMYFDHRLIRCITFFRNAVRLYGVVNNRTVRAHFWTERNNWLIDWPLFYFSLRNISRWYRGHHSLT